MPRLRREPLIRSTFVVVCRDDKIGRFKGPYVLATRQIFRTYYAALTYSKTVASSREAFVIEGRWTELREPSKG